MDGVGAGPPCASASVARNQLRRSRARQSSRLSALPSFPSRHRSSFADTDGDFMLSMALFIVFPDATWLVFVRRTLNESGDPSDKTALPQVPPDRWSSVGPAMLLSTPPRGPCYTLHALNDRRLEIIASMMPLPILDGDAHYTAAERLDAPVHCIRSPVNDAHRSAIQKHPPARS